MLYFFICYYLQAWQCGKPAYLLIKIYTYMKIITNNHYRPVLSWHELTTKEQDELKDSYDTIEESTFFRFKDWCYDLNDFLRVNDHLHVRGTDHDLY